MKIYRLSLICLFSLFLSSRLFAQNLFPEKIDSVCNISNFCMDCGTPKATCDPFALEYISDMVNHSYTFRGAFEISFQVLVDSTGFCCVLSHTDYSRSRLSADLIRYLNGCIWKPAIVNGRPVNASVNVLFKVENGKISGQMQRMDLSELKPPGNPVIYNTQYTYSNPSLKTYDFTVFNKYNSPLPDNEGRTCVVDKSDMLWYATARGLVRFDGKTFYPFNETNSPLNATADVRTMAVDKDNNKWMYANNDVYMYNDSGWHSFNFNLKDPVIPNIYRIIANPRGEIFFTNSKGLLVARNNKIRLLDNQYIWDLPSNNVYYAYYDAHNRLWIGTFSGSIMMDNKQNVTVFNNSRTPLNNICITNMTADEKGDLYFSLYACKNPGGDNADEGIAVLKADGKWYHYNDKNSGMPSNTVNCMLYDKFEHVLWIGTQQAGLVRFDLKNGWEDYNNDNSPVPGYSVYQIAQDSKGVIYAATNNGLLMIKKK